MPDKQCSKCKERKPLGFFGKNRSMSDGMQHYCKPCKLTATIERAQLQQPKPVKQCQKCKERKSISAFGTARARPDGTDYVCKSCKKAIAQEWHQRSPRQKLAVCRRGALKRRPTENPISIQELVDMWRTQNGCCALSGVGMTWATSRMLGTSITMDRVNNSIGYTRSNLRLVCLAMNSFRGEMSDDETLAMATAFVEYQRRTINARDD